MRRPASFRLRVLCGLVAPRAVVLCLLWGLNQRLQLPVWLAFAVIGLDLSVLAWQLRRYHHLAEAHISDTGAMAESWGGYLLCLLAGFASLTLWWEMMLIAQRPAATESLSAQMRRAREALYTLERVEAADDPVAVPALRFSGEITYGLAARLRAQMEAVPPPRLIELNSPGGHVYAARGAAQVIAAAGLHTRVVGNCSSACTLLFMAGHDRSLGPGARLGFHGYGLRQVVHLPGYDIAAAQAKDRATFIAFGMQPTLAARIFDTPPEGMWYPDRKTLLEGGVLTR